MDDLKNVYGDALLSCLLARDITAADEYELTAEQRHVTDILRGWLSQVARQGPFEQRINLASGLLAYLPDAATTFANAARLACGGQVPEEHSADDEVCELLLRMGRDIYPGFLLPPSNDRLDSLLMPLSGPVFRHPQIDALCRAVYGDEALKRLFPGDYPNLDPTAERALVGLHSEVIFSSGRGGGLQLIGLIDSLLLAAYYRALLAGPLSMRAYFTALKTVLREVRKLASGRLCEVPVIFGLSNIELPPDTAAPVPWGTLYSPNRINKVLVPPSARIDALLVTKRPLKILHIAPFDPAAPSQHPFTKFQHYRPQMDAWATDTDRIASLMRLAFLLASPDEGFFAVQHASRTVLDPFQPAPLMQWSNQVFAPSPIAGLSQQALTRVQEWAAMTKDHPKRLGIAMRRTLSAVSDRTDLLDGFIDAVMAWENMFSGRPETNLRVCGAIAWLLEPDDYARRSQLFNELKDLYGKRSHLVHGAIETVANAGACRDRAVRIVVESMKRLYADDKLLNITDSADRGGVILLGAARDKITQPDKENTL
jgi:Apea-like HEPN